MFRTNPNEFTSFQPLTDSTIKLYTSSDTAAPSASQPRANKLRDVLNNALDSYHTLFHDAQKKQFAYLIMVRTHNNSLNQLMYTEAKARALFYIQVYNFLSYKNESTLTIPEDYKPIKLESLQEYSLDEGKLKDYVLHHSEHLKKLSDIMNSRIIDITSASLSDFETRARHHYHAIALSAFQFSLATLICQKNMQITENFTKLTYDLKSISTKTDSVATAVQQRFPVSQNANTRLKMRNKRGFRPAHASSSDSDTKTREKTKKFATSFCKEFIKNGSCNRQGCKFAHSVSEINLPDKRSEKRCIHRLNCFNLTFCSFKHTLKEIEHFNFVLDSQGMRD